MPAWKHRPALRLLLPFAAGILLQWYTALPLWTSATAAGLTLLLLLLYAWLPMRLRFGASAVQGALLQLLLLCTGALACQQADVRNQSAWVGHNDANVTAFTATLLTTASEKAASWKFTAELQQVEHGAHWSQATGKLLVYIPKSNGTPPPAGTTIQVAGPLQPVRSSGNPGAFDYARWCLFQGITHQAYARSYAALPGRTAQPFTDALESTRTGVVRILQKHISGHKEQGLAEALLIGYKEDLDKELNASYARTGVVHIIAISGMHLALVYGLLLLLTSPLGAPRWRLLRLLLVMGGLWSFSFLAGGGPSVLRSAVMFSFLAVGGLIGRKGDSLNSLLLAALVLLALNPFWLWDAGFQLSFTAVGGIILFYRPIYALYNTHNKVLDAIWKGAAVSLAAQVLTTPISLYQFHQFPLLFLVANLVAVPLSGLLVYGLITLCGLSFWPAAATLLGKVCTGMIVALNGWIDRVDAVPFGLWEGISISVLQTALLYGVIAGFAWALLRKKRGGLRWGALALLLFLGLRAWSFFEADRQQRLIVYNVPKHSAIELQDGRTWYYRGDAAPLQDQNLFSFHLLPAHTAARSKGAAAALPAAFRFGGKTVAQLDGTDALLPEIPVDLLLVAHEGAGSEALLERVGSVVLDASVSRRKASDWKALCRQEGVPCHDVQEQGAFILEQ